MKRFMLACAVAASLGGCFKSTIHLADEPGQLPGDREEAGLGQPLVVGLPVGSSQFRRQLVGLGAGFGPGCLVRVVPQ